jgi:hypothetical protein|tara:strand:- start:711 stop:1265 length:555 start_codon:yes stop_codon:yes gene_type:complete
MEEEMMPAPGSIEAKDPLAMAPAGYGLTVENERWPWGQPPREVNPEVALKAAIDSLEIRQTRDEMMKLLMVGASVEALVEGYIFQAFQEGRFMPDVGLMIKGPLAMYIANMAEENSVPYRFFENDDALTEGEMDDTTFFAMMQENNPAMFAYVAETLNEGIRKGNAPQPPKEENFMSMQGQAEE